jgi:predicted RNase H-like nuclease (RuvC/YqgF family)
MVAALKARIKVLKERNSNSQIVQAALQHEVEDLKKKLQEKDRDWEKQDATLRDEFEDLKKTLQEKEAAAQDEIETLKKRLEEKDISRAEVEARRTTFSRWKMFFFGLFFVVSYNTYIVWYK